jgi:O-antigen/teichoic acid export membrane protein
MGDRVARSQLLLAAGQAGRLVLFLAVAGLLGRTLTPADFAFVALVLSLFALAGEVMDMGTSAVAVRETAARPAAEAGVLASLLCWRRLSAAALAAAVLVLAASPVAHGWAQRVALVVLAGAIYLLHLNAYLPVFQLRQAFGRLVALGVGTQAAFALACVAAVKLPGAGVAGAAVACCAAARETLVVLGMRWQGARLLGKRLQARGSEPGVRELLQHAWMLGVAGIGYKLAVHAGVFFLYSPTAPDAAAQFGAAQRLLMPVVDLAWVLMGPLAAALGLAQAHGAAALRMQLEGHAKQMLGLAALAAALAYFAAPVAMQLLYGATYGQPDGAAVAAFRWLALAGLFAWATPVLVVAATTLHQVRALMGLGLACLVLAVVGNLWAGPRLGAEGAAMVVLGCEAFVFLSLVAGLAAQGRIRLGLDWLVYLAPAALLALALAALDGQPAWQIGVGLATLPAAVLLLSRLPASRACRESSRLTAAPATPRHEVGAG